MKPKIAICVGHSRFIGDRMDGGAVSVGGMSEHTYNCGLAGMISAKLDVDSVIVSSYRGNGYGSAQRWLADHIKEMGATAAVELHFNSATGHARGHEWLYWHSSPRSKALANALRVSMEAAALGLPSRGTKSKTAADRGAEFLRGTHCPAVICEPFFGSSPEDWEIARTRKADIAAAITAGITSWLADAIAG